MSVYTEISAAELEAFLGAFDVGRLREFEGITAGIENTNYFVSTTGGEFVLTLFEFTSAADLPYFLDLMAYLAEHGVMSAHPLADRAGDYLQTLKGKPAALVRRLSGASVSRPDRRHCAAIGAAMARMHLAGRGFPRHRANDRGPDWQRNTAAEVADRLDASDRALMEAAIAEQSGRQESELPVGVIHADLFRDNALFEDHALSGIIDFYYAHNGPLVYDLAVTVADWCFDAGGGFDAGSAAVLVGAYDAVRTVTPAERAAWPRQLRAAGLRFWLSRLKDSYFPRAGTLTHIKDPGPFRSVLLAAQDERNSNRIWA